MLWIMQLKKGLFPFAILALLSLLSLTLSCSREDAGPASSTSISGPGMLGQEDVERPVASLRPDQHGYYANYDSPHKLMTNFLIAWRTMDADEYSERILYDGTEESTDNDVYAPFTFYFAPGLDYWHNPLPDFWLFGEEVAAVTQLMSGGPGHGVIPGVASISLILIPQNDWSPPADPDYVAGDPYPEGTLRRNYTAAMIVELDGEIPGDNISVFEFTQNQEFYVIPVVTEIGGVVRVNYRLWKWFELGVGYWMTESVTWGFIKALY